MTVKEDDASIEHCIEYAEYRIDEYDASDDTRCVKARAELARLRTKDELADVLADVLVRVCKLIIEAHNRQDIAFFMRQDLAAGLRDAVATLDKTTEVKP